MIVRCYASLSVASKTLSAGEIARVLKAEGDQVERGTPIIVRGKVLRLQGRSVWSIDSTLDESEPAESHMKNLLNFAEARAQEFQTLAPNCETRMWLTLVTSGYQGGFTLDQRVLKRLADLNIRIEVSFMGGDEEAAEDN